MIINFDDYKHNKHEMIIACIKKQIIGDYQFTPQDMTDEMINKLNSLANEIYNFHNFIKNRPPN